MAKKNPRLSGAGLRDQLVKLLDELEFGYEMTDDRLPIGRGHHGPCWAMVTMGEKLIAIETPEIHTSQELKKFIARARSALSRKHENESLFHPDEYWGVSSNLEGVSLAVMNTKLFDPEKLEEVLRQRAEEEEPSAARRIEKHIVMRVANALKTMGWKS